MMKKITNNSIIVLLLIIASTLYAQQDPSYTMYQYNMNVINPAYAGTSDYSGLNINFRSQWINIEGGPETQSISFGMPVNDKVGVGLSIVNDNVFVLNETDIYADFSYKVQLNSNTELYMGLKVGGSFINIDLDNLGIYNDPLFAENVSRFNPNFGVGFYLKGEKYYINLSSPAILKSKRYDKEGVVVSNASDELHMYAGAGYTFDLNNDIDLTPSVMSRLVVGAPVSIDISTTIDFYSRVEFGVSYRLDESVSLIGLFKFTDWMHLGYAYDITTSEVSAYSDGTHEIVLQFKF